MSGRVDNLKLEMAQIKKIKVGEKIAIIGMSGSGKTVILKSIMKRFQNVPACIVITGSEEGNGNFEGVIPDSFIFEEWTEEIGQKILARQKAAFSKLSREEKEASLRGEITRASLIFIMDDCGDDSSNWGKSKLMKKFFMIGRQLGMIVVITLQDPMDMATKLRTQLNWIFLLKEKSFNNRVKLHKHYAGVVPTFDIFDKIMRNGTEDYACIVVDNGSTSYDIDKSIYWYKAPMYDKFRMGSDKFWDQHARKYNPKYEENSNTFNQNPTNSKPRVRITKMYRGKEVR